MPWRGLGSTPASFLCSPPRDSITVVLGQHFFNRTTDVTQTFGIEKYVPYTMYSVFNPSNHDLGELRASVKWGVGLCAPSQSPDKGRSWADTRGKEVRGVRGILLPFLWSLRPPVTSPLPNSWDCLLGISVWGGLHCTG